MLKWTLLNKIHIIPSYKHKYILYYLYSCIVIAYIEKTNWLVDGHYYSADGKYNEAF